MTPSTDKASERPAPDAGAGVVAWYAEGFRDGLGDRLLLFDTSGPGLELLRVNGDLARGDGFEALLRDRVSTLQGFRHPAFAQVRTVKWLDDARPTLAVVSEHQPGERLSRVLRLARARGLRPSPDAVVWMLRQLLPGLAALQERQGIAHGLLTADRIVVSPEGGLAIADHVFAGAIERQRFAPFEMWDRFGVVVRPGSGLSRQGDVEQVARLAVAMLTDRTDVSSPGPVPAAELVAHVRERLVSPADRRLADWIARALGVDEPAFYTARAAAHALDGMLLDRGGEWATWLLPLPPERRALADGQSAVLGEPGDETEASATVLMSPAELDALGAAAKAAAARVTGDLPPVLLPLIAPKARRHRLWRYAAIGLATIAGIEGIFLLADSRNHAAPAPLPVSGPGVARVPAAVSQHTDTPAAAPAPVAPAPVAAAPIAPPIVPAAPRPVAAAPGWLSVRSNIPLRVHADGRLLGSGTIGTYRLRAGDHTILLENMDAGVHDRRTVRVPPGQTVWITKNVR